jgi:hypothetical protein
MGNKTLAQALRTLTIRVAVLSGNHVSAKSLTGAAVQVRMAPVEELQTLFVMTDRWQGFTCRVHMRPATAPRTKSPSSSETS